MTTPVIAKALTHRFGDTTVVRDLDLRVPAGTIQGFVGPSGSGKTTTVRILAGVLTPSAGTVRVLDTDPRRLDTHGRRRIGYMPQLRVLYPHLTVARNLRFVADLYGVPKPKRRIAETLDLLDLTDAATRLLRDCSGGMQRRVSLAAALLHDPDIIFLDEPTSGLDPVLRKSLWDHFARLRDDGRSLFVTTQIVSEAEMCDRVALLADGRIVADGSPDDLRQRAMGGDQVDMWAADPVPDYVVDLLVDHEDVARVERLDGRRLLRLTLNDGGDAPTISDWLANEGVEVTVTERHVAAFDDVFVRLLETDR